MQIVIDIPNKDYQVTLTKIMLACYGCKITELPKGHGRLGDLDALYQEIETRGWFDSDDAYYGGGLEDIVLSAPTLIEADKEVDDGDSN